MKLNATNLLHIIFSKVTRISAAMLIIFSTGASDIPNHFTKEGRAFKKAGQDSFWCFSFAHKTRTDNSLIIVPASQGRIVQNPFSTDAVAPIIRGTGVKMGNYFITKIKSTYIKY